MKNYYQVTKIGNSLFATLPNRLVKQLGLQPGDKIVYNLSSQSKKVELQFFSQRHSSNLQETMNNLSAEDKLWLDEMAGSLTF